MTPRPRTDAGVVLLVVLWTLALLTLLSTTITGTGRREADLGAALRASATARTAAEAALHETIFDLLTGRRSADAITRRLPIGPNVAQVRVTDEDSKLNPNTAPADLLAALLRVAGADPATAQSLAAAIIAWRGSAVGAGPDPKALATYRAAGRAYGPPAEPFHSIDELRLVLGMTPPLYGAIAPNLSVYAEGVLNPQTATPMLRQALELAGIQPASPDPASPDSALGTPPPPGPVTVAITVRVQAAGGAVARIAATVRLDPGNPDRPFAVLTWDDPPDAD